jgi:hypothetical protein
MFTDTHAEPCFVVKPERPIGQMIQAEAVWLGGAVDPAFCFDLHLDIVCSNSAW